VSGLLIFFLIAALGLAGCADSLKSHPAPQKWTTGFWFWRGSSIDTTWSGEPLDALFVHAGSISKDDFSYSRQPWRVSAELPDLLPKAQEYWVVFRYEKQGVPDLSVAAMVADKVSNLQQAARKRHLNLAGVQLDIDSPTGSLPQYASFLREVRKGLPKGFEISITALLDWFRDGTAIAEVIKETNEFVPQFYDVGDLRSDDGAIAAKIDATRWGPLFNRYGTRFRIGVSTFGRVRMVPKPGGAGAGYFRSLFFRDVSPLDIGTNPAFDLQATRSQADELVLNYRANRKTRIAYNDFEAGESIRFTVSTPEAVHAAVDSVKRMKGNLAGVLFFRWPASDESLAMRPDEVLIAAGLITQDRRTGSSITAVDGSCTAVKCADLVVLNTSRFSPKAVRYRIRSSTELEYFLPEKRTPVRMSGASELELSLPPYGGRARLYLGRAVTASPATFTLEEEQ